MISLCKIHDKIESVNVSWELRDILKNKKPSKEEVVEVFVFKVEDGKKTNKYSYFISRGEVIKLGLHKGINTIELLDRDKQKKELNDRALVVKIKNNLAPICDRCFEELLRVIGC